MYKYFLITIIDVHSTLTRWSSSKKFNLTRWQKNSRKGAKKQI